jgi:hypothetical protein
MFGCVQHGLVICCGLCATFLMMCFHDTQSLERLATRRVSFAIPDEPAAVDTLSDSHPDIPATYQRALQGVAITSTPATSSQPSPMPLSDLSSFSRVHTAVPAWTITSHPHVLPPNMDDTVNDDDDDDMWARSVMPTPMAKSIPPTRTPAAEAVSLQPPTLTVPYGSRATASTSTSAKPIDADLFYAARSGSTPSPRALSPSAGLSAAPVNPLDFASVRQVDQHLRRLQAAAARLPFMTVPAQDSELTDLLDPVVSTFSVSSVALSTPAAPSLSLPAGNGTVAATTTTTAAMMTTPAPVPRDPPDSAPRRAPNSASVSAKSTKTTTPVRCVLFTQEDSRPATFFFFL